MLMNYEPEMRKLLTMIVPKYMKQSYIYGAMVEAVASENGCTECRQWILLQAMQKR